MSTSREASVLIALAASLALISWMIAVAPSLGYVMDVHSSQLD